MVVTAVLLSLMVLLMPFALDAFENFLFPRPSASDRTAAHPGGATDLPEHGGPDVGCDLPGTI